MYHMEARVKYRVSEGRIDCVVEICIGMIEGQDDVVGGG
jgi:hypothetical protein